jgi:putative photosynthetic complex assembly protein 2
VMLELAGPPLAAVLLWWLGTGAVILLDRLPAACGGNKTVAFVAASSVTVAALLCIGHTARDASVAGAYAGFSCAVLVWGWHELAFISGWVTGPRRTAVTPGASRWQRLSEAVQVLLWHELALIATTGVLWAWLGGSANPTAAWTFTLLYAMRVSAKLNLYLGVRNLALDFLPPHLVYLGSYFRTRRFNALMPLSLVAGAAVVAWLISAAAATQDGARTAHLLLASLLVLALVEHLMMVLPLQPSALWRWALRLGQRQPA